MNQDKEIK